MKSVFWAVALVAVAGLPAFAHHSFARFYREDQSVTITGELVEFRYTNPHAWVDVVAPDASGTMQRYAAEWGSPNRLGRRGITKDTLRPGERVVLTGSPGRDPGEHRLHLKAIRRLSDGWNWGGGGGRRRR